MSSPFKIPSILYAAAANGTITNVTAVAANATTSAVNATISAMNSTISAMNSTVSAMNATMSQAANASAPASAQPAAAAGPVAAAAAPFKDKTIVYYFDVALLVVLAAFVLAFLPRAIARWTSKADLGKGLILLPGSFKGRGSGALENVATRNESFGSDDTHVQTSTAAFVRRPGAKQFSPPRHVSSWNTLLYPGSSFFDRPFIPGISLGQLLVILIYTGGIIFMYFYFSNPITGSKREGFIVISQIPVVFILATKNNVAGYLLGVGYEKLNVFHRWVGIVTAVSIHLHAGGFVYRWVSAGTLGQELQVTFVRWGIVGLASLDLLAIFSISFFRNRVYNFFLVTHIFGFILFPIAACYHTEAAINYVAIAAAFYAFDHLLRLIKTRVGMAIVQPLPELSAVRLEVPKLNRGWRAGQHVRLRVFSSELGLTGWAESHPFTIASTSMSEGGEGLVLVCKRVGGWTGKLYEAASKPAGSAEVGLSPGSRKMVVQVEGPYGGLGHMVLGSYSAAIIVVGGSGVTFGLSAVAEMLQDASQGLSRTKFIELIWIVQDKNAAVPFMTTLNSLLQRSDAVPGLILHIALHYTRASACPTNSDEEAALKNPFSDMDSRIDWNIGRPNLSTTLDWTVERASALPEKMGVAVGVCGPVGLGEQVRKTVASVDGSRRFGAGGIELHTETFGW